MYIPEFWFDLIQKAAIVAIITLVITPNNNSAYNKKTVISIIDYNDMSLFSSTHFCSATSDQYFPAITIISIIRVKFTSDLNYTHWEIVHHGASWINDRGRPVLTWILIKHNKSSYEWHSWVQKPHGETTTQNETSNDKIVLIILVAWNKKSFSRNSIDCFKNQAPRIWLCGSLIGVFPKWTRKSVNSSNLVSHTGGEWFK